MDSGIYGFEDLLDGTLTLIISLWASGLAELEQVVLTSIEPKDGQIVLHVAAAHSQLEPELVVSQLLPHNVLLIRQLCPAESSLQVVGDLHCELTIIEFAGPLLSG